MRYVVYLTGDASPYTLERYGDYGVLFENLFRGQDDEWEVFDSRKMEYPESLDAIDAIVLTGSASDAHAREPWIIRLEEEIRRAYDQDTPLLGFCFGHQAVANALGGKTGRNPKGWEIGLHAMQLTPQFHQQPYTSGINALNVLEIHQDHVLKAPPDAVILASTPDTPVQIFAIGSKVLCMQGHPEFENDIVADLVTARMDSGKICREKGAAALASMNGTRQDQSQCIQMVARFLGKT